MVMPQLPIHVPSPKRIGQREQGVLRREQPKRRRRQLRKSGWRRSARRRRQNNSRRRQRRLTNAPEGMGGTQLEVDLTLEEEKEQSEDTNAHIQQMNAGGQPLESMDVGDNDRFSTSVKNQSNQQPNQQPTAPNKPSTYEDLH